MNCDKCGQTLPEAPMLKEAKRRVQLPSYEIGCDHQGSCKQCSDFGDPCFKDKIKAMLQKIKKENESA